MGSHVGGKSPQMDIGEICLSRMCRFKETSESNTQLSARAAHSLWSL
jgi:hypothetical protein